MEEKGVLVALCFVAWNVSGEVTQPLGLWKRHVLVTADPSAPLLAWFK